MAELQAVIFDMDGTLIDSEVLWVDAIEAALRQRLVGVTRAEVIRLVYGHAWPDIFREIEHSYPGAYVSRQAMEAVTVPLFKDYSRRRDIRIHPSIALLRALARRFPVAIVSGSTRSRVRETVENLDLGPCLALYLGCEDVPAGKPDPAGFLKAAQAMGVASPACLVFEDSTAGVRAAKAAGMYCVALRRENAGDQDLSAADLVLPCLGDFDLERFCAGLA